MRHVAAFTLGFAISFGLGACANHEVGNNSDYVGGPCESDSDCIEECAQGGSFPGGTCTVPCSDDDDCPDGTSCIDRMGGVCLLDCGGDGDCRGGYECSAESRKGHGGEAQVCIES